MWREYTRETPAKPGWAIASAGAALALTTGLAWVLAHQGVASVTLGSSLAPRYWPISFTLPTGAEPLREWNRIRMGIHPTGNFGRVAYRLPRANGGDAPEILLTYKVCEDESDLQDEKFGFSSADFTEGEPIDMGPMEARVLMGFLPTHELLFSAVGLIEEGELGLVIRIQMICPPETKGAERLFRGICRGVEFRDWHLSSYMDMYFRGLFTTQ